MAFSEHKKGGNCPKSKSSNYWTRKEMKESSGHFYRINGKKAIKEQLNEYDIESKDLENLFYKEYDKRSNNIEN